MDRDLWKKGIAVAALMLALPLTAFAQETETKAQEEETQKEIMKQIEELKKGQDELRKQLQEVLQLLRARPAARAPARPSVENVVFDLDTNPIQGDPSAKLTLVEFTDYQ